MSRAILGTGLAVALTTAAWAALAQDGASAPPDDVIRYVPSSGEPTAPRDEPPLAEPPSFRAALDVGGSAQRMIALPVYGVDLGGSIGVDFGSTSSLRGLFDGRLELAIGKTPDGLAARTIHLAPEVGVIVGDRVRLGAGVQLTNAGFWRRTTGDVVDNWLCGAGVFLDVDVVRFDEHALFVALRGSVDASLAAAPGTSANVQNGSLTLGIRY